MEDDAPAQEKRPQVIKPNLVRGLQKKTAAPDLGDDFEHKEKEVARGLYAAQVVPSPPALAAAAAAPSDGTEGSRASKETVIREVSLLKSEAVVLELEERTLKAEQRLQEEMTVQAREAAYRSEVLKLASRSTYINNKIFFYPDPAVATFPLEIFFNRSITALAGKPAIFVKGGFNDWRWGSFYAELQSTTELQGGDWLSCKIEVPREAFKVDFIFFDGQTTFENNSGQNFFIQVEGGLSKGDFEYFLLEEKAKEAQRVADEKARKEREAVEGQRVAEHKAAEVADRAEAKRLVIEKRESARMALQKAVRRVHGLWYIEPAEFGGGDFITLHYNRSLRPLAQSKEIWIHAGSNNWEDMVSLVTRLVPARSPKTAELDWWSARGTPSHPSDGTRILVTLDVVSL